MRQNTPKEYLEIKVNFTCNESAQKKKKHNTEELPNLF